MGTASARRRRTTGRKQRESTLPEGHAGCIDARRRTLTFEVVCWLVLARGVLTELPLRQVFEACRP